MNTFDTKSFADASFLTGANAAYIEDLYARFESDPASVDAEWAAYFTSLKEERAIIENAVREPSWKLPNWPLPASGEMVSALDGNWPSAAPVSAADIKEKVKAKAKEKALEMTAAEVERATRDSVRAIMMILAYRMRGHLHADLDPLGIEQLKDHEELHPQSYGFTEADYT
jgi:2-oxoglutarate dehydrogenase E1 component